LFLIVHWPPDFLQPCPYTIIEIWYEAFDKALAHSKRLLTVHFQMHRHYKLDVNGCLENELLRK